MLGAYFFALIGSWFRVEDGQDLQGDVVRNKFPISVLKSQDAKFVSLSVSRKVKQKWKFHSRTRWNSECWVLFWTKLESMSLSIRDAGLKVVNRNSNELIQERCHMSSYAIYDKMYLNPKPHFMPFMFRRRFFLHIQKMFRAKNSWILVWQLLSRCANSVFV